MKHGKYPFIIGFLVVPVALYATFVVAAYVQAFQLSFTNWRGFSPDVEYIGFDNFVKLCDDSTLLEGDPAPRRAAGRPAADHHRHRAVLRLPAQRGRRLAAAGVPAGSGGRSSTGWCSSSPSCSPWPWSR